MTFKEIYDNLLKDRLSGTIKSYDEYDKQHLDCLLNPTNHLLVIKNRECTCNDDNKKCVNACVFDAISIDEKGKVTFTNQCVGCEACIKSCDSENLTVSKDSIAVIDALKNKDQQVYALIAPAFLGQFSSKVTPGMLRSAFKQLGFAGMIEVAVFADILTLKEALEFDRHVKKSDDFIITSCCCPMWIAMIKKIYKDLVPHLPPSVSPMVAAGRVVKKINNGAKTVFIGPCLAKKAEAREKDIADAVDNVLTFQEISEIFKVAGINPEDCQEDLKDHSSAMGRIYARSQGVSEAVKQTLERLSPDRDIPFNPINADGVPACKAMLNDIAKGEIKANFIEGMGCVGGCVGGPRIIIDREKGRDLVNEYVEKATYLTPIDNPYVIELLKQLGFETPESLLNDGSMFTRHF